MAPDALLEPRRVTYFISSRQPPLSDRPDLTGVERRLLDSASKRGLQVYSGRGLCRGRDLGHSVTVYRLSSDRHHAFCDVLFEGTGANLLTVHVLPQHQGNGFRLKDFLINRVAGSLFDIGVSRLFGLAAANDYPIRQGRCRGDWRNVKHGGGTRLLALYGRLGFQIHPQTSTVTLMARPASGRVYGAS